MRRKLVLDVDSLTVETFEAGAAPAERRGTVRGAGAACTCAASCDCPTAIFHCAEIAWTVYSCDYTQNESCVLTTPRGCTAG